MSSIDTRQFEALSGVLDWRRLSQRAVTIVGLGRMGQPVSEQLVRHGVAADEDGRIRLLDGDTVSPRNLVGTGYRYEHIGMAKVEAAASILVQASPSAQISLRRAMLGTGDVRAVVEQAQQSDLLCLFADDLPVMMAIADACHSICPQIMAVFGPRCSHAEIAFSVPGQTVPISALLGRRRERIAGASALGCDTLFVTSLVTAICLRLLLGESRGNELLPPCYGDAPLFLVGLRREWLFSSMPQDQLRSVCLVGAPAVSSLRS